MLWVGRGDNKAPLSTNKTKKLAGSATLTQPLTEPAPRQLPCRRGLKVCPIPHLPPRLRTYIHTITHAYKITQHSLYEIMCSSLSQHGIRYLVDVVVVVLFLYSTEPERNDSDSNRPRRLTTTTQTVQASEQPGCGRHLRHIATHLCAEIQRTATQPPSDAPSVARCHSRTKKTVQCLLD